MLVPCPECKQQISDQALICPSCGTPQPKRLGRVIGVVRYAHARRAGGILFFGGIAWLFFAAQTGGSAAFALVFGTAKWIIGAGVVVYIVAEILRNLDRSQKPPERP